MLEEAAYYNALALLTKSHYDHLAALFRTHGSWLTAWRSLPKEAVKEFDPRTHYQKLQAQDIHLVLSDESSYPEPLREIPHPPLGLYYKGRLPKSFKPSLSIVGTRRASREGIALARHFAATLGQAGCLIVSGLALGIDSAGHEGALAKGAVTLAVLGHGLHDLYPATNAKLARDILSHGGTLLSEYPLGTPSLAYRFLERNRIVSGLTQGTLIIEAPHQSGALVTARFALEQNREVFVVPGPVQHPNFQGSHQLLKSGAAYVTEPEDIAEALGLALTASYDASSLNKTERLIVEALRTSTAPLTVDQIIDATKLEVVIINQLLSWLTLKNIIQETEGGYALTLAVRSV